MKKITTVVMMAALTILGVMGCATRSYASDWDKAGKILTGIEGVRIITGGKFDLIGNMFGISNKTQYPRGYNSQHRVKNNNKHTYSKRQYCSHRTWIPNYVWKKKYVPKHTEYDPEYGEVIVEGHYIRYQVEQGGKWIQTCSR